MIDIAKLRQRARIEFKLSEVATVLGLQPGGEAVVTLTAYQDQPEGRAPSPTREERVVLVRVDRDTLAAYEATPGELAASPGSPPSAVPAAPVRPPGRIPHQIPANARLNLDAAAVPAAETQPLATETRATSAPAAQGEPAKP